MANLPPPSPPVVEYVRPAPTAQNIGLDSEIYIKFQEPVKAGYGSIVLSNGLGDTRKIAMHDSSQVRIYDAVEGGDYSDRLLIRPKQNLLASSIYYVLADAGFITSIEGVPIAGVTDPLTYNFSTSNDNSTPTPLSATILDNEKETTVFATFNEPIKSGVYERLLKANISNAQGISKNMGLTFEDNTVKLSVSDLPPNSEYFLTVDAGTITDLAGNAFAGVDANQPFRFSIVRNDTVAPSFSRSAPSDPKRPVSVGEDIELFFNEKIKLGKGFITLSNGLNDTREIAVDDATQVIFQKNPSYFGYTYSIILKPSALLAPNSQYSIKLDPGIVTDLSDNPFPGLPDSQKISFSTQSLDTTAPALEKWDMGYEKEGHTPVWREIYLSFNEHVKLGTGNITISNGIDDTRTISVQDITQIDNRAGFSLTINPSADLHPGSRYHVLIDNGAITELEGNAFAGVQGTNALVFTTEPLWTAANNPVEETNKGSSVGVYESGDILTFHFNAPISGYASFMLSDHTFGGNDVMLSQDGLSVSVELSAESTVVPGDVLIINRAEGKPGADGVTPKVDIEFTL